MQSKICHIVFETVTQLLLMQTWSVLDTFLLIQTVIKTNINSNQLTGTCIQNSLITQGSLNTLTVSCVYTISWLSTKGEAKLTVSGFRVTILKPVIIYTGTGSLVQNSEFSNSGFQSIFYYRKKEEKIRDQQMRVVETKFWFCQILVFSNHTVVLRSRRYHIL